MLPEGSNSATRVGQTVLKPNTFLWDNLKCAMNLIVVLLDKLMAWGLEERPYTASAFQEWIGLWSCCEYTE